MIRFLLGVALGVFLAVKVPSWFATHPQAHHIARDASQAAHKVAQRGAGELSRDLAQAAR